MTDDQKPQGGGGMGSNAGLALAASQMGIFVAVGLLGGLWLDRKLDTTPWLGFAGLIAGFALGIQILIRLVRGSEKK
mgnify:CR=1 FL=1